MKQGEATAPVEGGNTFRSLLLQDRTYQGKGSDGIDNVVTNPMHAWATHCSLLYLVAGYGGIGWSPGERLRVRV